MIRAVVALVLPWLFVASFAVAQSPSSPPPGAPPSGPTPEVRATPLDSPISIDGALTEPVWQSIEPCSSFVQRDPVEGARPSQHTEVRVLFDADALYVGVRLFDSEPAKIIKELARRDGGTRSDRFTLYLDPYRDRRSGYYFGINAAGTQYDGTLYNDGWSNDSWDGVWEGRVAQDGQGWTAEMRIPFSQLRFAQADVQTWGINFGRQMGRGFEDCYFVNRPKKSNGFVSLFPPLVGLQRVNPTNAIEILPYATSKAEFLRHDASDPFNDGSRMRPNVGADLRMPLGSKLTLNGTVNPDFGQVEVDPAVVNLSDVETFFPEKRPFFVEGSSIFEAGQQGASDYWSFNYQPPTFFYTRRIGHAPQGDTPDEAMYSDVPIGTTILGAAKVSGKLASDLNFGMLHALTDRETAHNQRADFSKFRSTVEPMSYYGVGRFLKEFPGRKHGLGGLTTVAIRNLSADEIENQFNRTAVSAILDGWHYLDRNEVWVMSGWAGGSVVSGTQERITSLQTNSRRYYQRPDAESFSVDPDATSLSGTGARVNLNKEKGNVFTNAALGFISPGFEINDLGFQPRADLVNGHAGFGYKWTEPTKQVKNKHMIGAVFGGTDFDGNLVSAGAWGKAFWWYTNNWTAQITAAYNPETVNPRRSRGGPLMLNKPGYELGLFGDTDGSRVRYYYVDYYQYLQPEENSFNYRVSPFFAYKPAPNVKIDLGPSYEVARDGAFFVASIDDPTATATYGSRHVFARLDQQTFAANIRVNWSFTPTMTLQFYGQPLVATGRYSDLRELARPKSLDFIGQGSGAWTYDPATRSFDSDGAGPEGSEVLDFNTKSLRGNAVFRWEYLPGSAFYLVWTQQRTDEESIPDFRLGPSFRRLTDAQADNIFLAKVTYYLNR